MNESINIQGFVTFDVYDENGRLLRSINKKNLVTNDGKNFLVRRIIGDASTSSVVISDVAVGSGTTAATTADTDLENETARVEVDAISDSGNVGEFLTSLEVGVATGTISEAGLYTNDSTPTLVSRIVLGTPFTKGASESIQISWQFKIGSDS